MDIGSLLQDTGRSLVRAGAWVGQQVASGYHAVDPDVRRHIAQMPLLGFTYLSPRRERLERLPADGYRPIVFVHGLGGHAADFLPMATYLRLFGRRRTYRIDLSEATTVASMAQALATYVQAVRDVTGADRVELVAHSMGGIIARAAIADHGLEDSVATLITLGTPHAGTYAARFANTTLTTALRPDSPLMQRLAAAPLPAGVRVVSMWSENDVLVIPARSAALPETEHVELSPFTHYGYLLSRRGWEAVRQHLGGPLD